MNEELIAPCGMNCNICSRYLALRNDIKSHGIRMTYCSGCLPSGMNCHYKRQCDLLGKGLVRFCYDCGDFPCRRLKTLDKRYRTFYHMSMIENLQYIKENGIRQFLDREKERWKCPECGGTISCHNGICFNCGLDLLKNKKKRYRWQDD
jgi:hypothetical protein